MQNETYVLTMDVPETLARKYGITEALVNPDLRERLETVQEVFAASYQAVMPDGVNTRLFYTGGMTEQLTAAAEKMRSAIGNPIVVSLDHVYDTKADFHLEITRETNPMTGQKKLANRFGTPPINEQFKTLRRLSRKRGANSDGVLLTDVGSFEGGTLGEVTKRLETYGIPLQGVVIGLTSSVGMSTLTAKFGEKIQMLEVIPSMFEWVEVRDLILIDGRKVPQIYTQDGVRRYIPYIDNLRDWATLRTQAQQDLAARLCNTAYSEVITLLRETGANTTARIGEFVHLGQKPPSRTKSLVYG